MRLPLRRSTNLCRHRLRVSGGCGLFGVLLDWRLCLMTSISRTAGSLIGHLENRGRDSNIPWYCANSNGARTANDKRGQTRHVCLRPACIGGSLVTASLFQSAVSFVSDLRTYLWIMLSKVERCLGRSALKFNIAFHSQHSYVTRFSIRDISHSSRERQSLRRAPTHSTMRQHSSI
jgi:hypothetical protein